MNDNIQSLGEALNQFAGQKKMKNSIHEIRIVTFWGELMGDLVNKYTEKIYRIMSQTKTAKCVKLHI